jgi:hypothetical protein
MNRLLQGAAAALLRETSPCDDLLHFRHPGLSCKALPTWSFWVKGDAVRGGNKPELSDHDFRRLDDGVAALAPEG